MRICGIVAEYNPFHNGHKFHIENARRLSSADGIIVVMSGSFVQRGQPALFDKYVRAKTAVLCGADLVIELPFCFSSAPAQFFAEGGIKLLSATGIVNSVCFGSERGDLNTLLKLTQSPENLKPYLDKGMSYPSACAAASDFSISQPNDILAVEYLRAISLYAPNITPYALKRCDKGYHSDEAENEFASASLLRDMIVSSGFGSVKPYLPEKVYDILYNEYTVGNYIDSSLLDALILGKIRSGESLKSTAYVSEGLENRFFDKSFDAISISELISAVKTKRYTHARLSRIISAFSVGLSDDLLGEFVKSGPGYLRVLASNDTGKKMLSQIKKRGSLPVITTPSSYKKLDLLSQKMFELDCMSGDIAALAKKNPALRKGRQDFNKLNIFSD